MRVPPVPQSLITNMRHCRALTILVLFVLLLRIGSVAACTQHELADLGLGANGTTVVEKLGDTTGADGLAAHAASCTHCQCHHAAAVPVSIAPPTTIANTGVPGERFDEPPSAPLPLTLRPPIA